MAMHIVLVAPQIAPNAGNIARTCVATDTVLHFVEPMKFSLEDKYLKRAALDYWQYVKLEVHESLDAFLQKYAGRRMFLATTKGGTLYTEVQYRDEDMLLFGKETAGLPAEFIEANRESTIKIPMSETTKFRSLNQANSANIILFEALRQQGFPGLK